MWCKEGYECEAVGLGGLVGVVNLCFGVQTCEFSALHCIYCLSAAAVGAEPASAGTVLLVNDLHRVSTNSLKMVS